MINRSEGIVLKSFSYDEADVIARIFTKKQGKIDVLAKGAKKMKSRLSSSIQVFTLGEFSYYQKNNNLAILQQSEIVKSYKNIVSNLDLTFMVYYICEFLDYFLADYQEQSKVFDLTAKTLDFLNNYDDSSQAIFMAFKIKAMALLGYSPNLTNCITCGKDHSHDHFIFSIKEGGLICSTCLPNNKTFLHKKEILLLLFLLKSTYEEILRVSISPQDLKTVEVIVSKYILHHTEGHVFKSEGLLKNL